MHKRDVQEEALHANHNDRLNEKSIVEVRAKPVKDSTLRSALDILLVEQRILENAGKKHNQRDIKGEAGGGSGSVDGVDLVGIGCDRRRYEAPER
jgi:hypothetical protein